MSAPGLNGISYAAQPAADQPHTDQHRALARIEGALTHLADALTLAGFSREAAVSVTIATRSAILLVKANEQ